MNDATRIIPAWLLALGRSLPPPIIHVADETFMFVKCFKHDFFAATSLYEGGTGRVVLKIGRTQPLWGLPMMWLGRMLFRHEARLYKLSQGIEGVPKLVGRWGPTGLVHAYVEGRPLRRDDRPDDRFFYRLATVLSALHERKIAYVDLEKPENVLLGDDGRPHLIDFQISWHVPANRLGETWPAQIMLAILQSSDRYHLMKHWRKLRPDQLADAADSLRIPFWIKWHRAVFRPVTLLRRQVLVWMGLRESVKFRSPG